MPQAWSRARRHDGAVNSRHGSMGRQQTRRFAASWRRCVQRFCPWHRLVRHGISPVADGAASPASGRTQRLRARVRARMSVHPSSPSQSGWLHTGTGRGRRLEERCCAPPSNQALDGQPVMFLGPQRAVLAGNFGDAPGLHVIGGGDDRPARAFAGKLVVPHQRDLATEAGPQRQQWRRGASGQTGSAAGPALRCARTTVRPPTAASRTARSSRRCRGRGARHVDSVASSRRVGSEA